MTKEMPKDPSADHHHEGDPAKLKCQLQETAENSMPGNQPEANGVHDDDSHDSEGAYPI